MEYWWHCWYAHNPIFYLSFTERQAEIHRLKGELVQKQQKLNELDVFRQRRASLSSDINRYSNATSIYDSIAPGSDRWSRISALSCK